MDKDKMQVLINMPHTAASLIYVSLLVLWNHDVAALSAVIFKSCKHIKSTADC